MCTTSIDKKKMVNSIDQFERSPLFYAAFNSNKYFIIYHSPLDNYQFCEFLLKTGANTRLNDFKRRTM
jgi:hypothetical protein